MQWRRYVIIDKNYNSSWPGKDGQNSALCTGQNSPGSSLNIEMEILCSSIYTAATWENVSSRLMLVINRIYEPSPYNLTA